MKYETGAAPGWHLYMVECADGRLYAGITTDPARRFAEHSAGGIKAAKALRGKGPLRLVFAQPVGTRSAALSAEYRLKQLSRAEKLQVIQERRFELQP